MNPYLILGIIAGCAIVFSGVVAFLTIQGVPLLLALVCVYLLAICFMLGLQRRARDAEDYSADADAAQSYSLHQHISDYRVDQQNKALPECTNEEIEDRQQLSV